VADHNNSEIWVYYVSKDSATEYADKALIWNWKEAIWTKRDLQGISFIAEGYVDLTVGGVDDWDSSVGTWDEDTATWAGDISFNSQLETLLLSSYNGKKFFANEYTEGADAYFPTSSVKRIGIDFDDDRSFKLLSRIVPHINSSNPVTITIYTSDIQTSNPSIAATIEFNPQEDEDIDCHCVGRYIGVQFSSNNAWTLNGYTLEWSTVGSF